jgi:hypothetical protein
MALTTLPTAALANDAVDNTKLDLADNYAFTGTVTGAGAWNLLQTTTVSSSVASVTMGTSSLLTDTYKVYCFTGSNIHVDTDGASGNARIVQSGSAVTASSYRNTKIRMNSGSATVSGFVNEAASRYADCWGESIGSSTGENTSFLGYLYNPSATDQYKIYYQTQGAQNTSNSQQLVIASYSFTGNTNAVEGLQFYLSSGNISTGTFSLYGLSI